MSGAYGSLLWSLLAASLLLCGGMSAGAQAAGGGLLSGPQAGINSDDRLATDAVETPSPAAGLQQGNGADDQATVNNVDDQAAGVNGGAAANSGPVRLARFSYLKGDVTWRADAQSDWTAAAQNMPLRQGVQVWVGDDSRAEVQFDDGSRVRLDANSLVTLQTLYSDADGEFTEITLNEGEVFLRLSNQYSVYQVNTPGASLKASGPARVRVGGGEGAQFAVRRGTATVEGPGGKATLQEGDYLDVVDNTTPYSVGPLPQPDAWDAWNDQRDRQIDDPTHAQPHLPSNIALVAGNLNAYGRWVNDPTYGWVWAPSVSDPEWRPYSAGSWTWVEPFGWTWVATEPWGWAPYHYGTWVHASYGWGWCPGPATQYWSPAVVSFYESGTRVAWCPLAPREVVYPSVLSLGFRGANWSLFFSIGGAAVYYPGPAGVCIARPWSSVYVNRVTYVTNVTNVTNITVNRNTYATNSAFVPSNARFAGGTEVELRDFAGNRTNYRPVPAGDAAVFARGHAIGAPSGGAPVAGPQAVRVSAAAFTPSRSYRSASSVPEGVANRSVYRTALPANVPRSAAAPQAGQRFTTRTSPSSSRTTNPTRASSPSASTGHSSALDDYLRDRDSTRSRSTDPSTGGSSRTSQPGAGSSTGTEGHGASVTTPRSSHTSSYRQLHRSQSGSASRDDKSRAGGDGKGSDKGH